MHLVFEEIQEVLANFRSCLDPGLHEFNAFHPPVVKRRVYLIRTQSQRVHGLLVGESASHEAAVVPGSRSEIHCPLMLMGFAASPAQSDSAFANALR
jgi:hypothetical protein